MNIDFKAHFAAYDDDAGLRGFVTNVVDGDTLDVVVDLGFMVYHTIRVRIAGINTPEMTAADPATREKAIAAKNRLIELCLNQPVMIHTYKAKTGAYNMTFNRYVADIMLKGRVQVGAMLVKEGHAVVFWP